MELDSRIYVAGHRGLVGSALVRRLSDAGYTNLVLRGHQQLDLCDPAATAAFFSREQPEYVFLSAGRVGGIWANTTFPADLIYTNLMIQTSVIDAARQSGVRRLIYFGSSCAYPRDCPQPMREEYLLDGPLESTSESYAISKIAGMKLCQAYNAQHHTVFVSVIPPTVYGPHDNFDAQESHVLSALVRRFDEARRAMQRGGTIDDQGVVVWGTGKPMREFLYADDLADACILLAEADTDELAGCLGQPALTANIGSGEEVSVRRLAEIVADVVGFRGRISFDPALPDGPPRKVLDSSRFRRLGWSSRVSLEDGIKRTVEWFRATGDADKPLAGVQRTS